MSEELSARKILPKILSASRVTRAGEEAGRVALVLEMRGTEKTARDTGEEVIGRE